MTNRFSSRLAHELEAFLEFKRSLGIQYDGAEWVLRRFDRYVAQNFEGRRPMDLKVAIEGWLTTFHCRPVTITSNFLVVRKFCLFLRRRDPNGFVPDRDLAPRVYESHHLPHIFSPAEIRILMDEIGKMRHPFRSRTYRALLLILYCTGLRTGEAVRLRIQDVDLREKVFRVEVSKAKSRWVPFGSPCGRKIVSPRIIALLRQTGLKPPTGRVGPRPYDTRHSFAVNRLTEWYREGVDLQKRLAWLSAYLGHDDLLGTQDYLQLTPELRRMVSARHEDYIRCCWDSEAR